MDYWNQGKELNNGKFIVEQLLGSGGFGVTYQVREIRTNKLFVIKTLQPEFKQEKNFKQLQLQFINEIIALASCRHPNIVRAYRKVFEEDDLICMVMDYIEGQTLGKYIRNRGKLSEEDAIALISKVGNALSYVHKQGILHRDIKPDNIMLRQADNLPVLIDFGLARELINDLTRQSMSHSGTPFYAPIEEYENQGNFGLWTDVYALAATLYVLVTGKAPGLFSHIRKYESIINQQDPLISPKQNHPALSDQVNEAILKGMELEPSDRPQSVEEWLKLLNPNPYILFFGDCSVTLQIFEFDTVKVNDKGKVIKTEHYSAKYFSEDLGNEVTLEMVKIPGGSFIMGSPEDELERGEDESPQHEVTVPSFYMGKYEVTQAQWKQVAALPHVERELKSKSSKFKGEELPVEQVNWYEAVEFCARLSKATGREYRLPSEAEWEYACRAGTTTPFYFGETITTELVNYRGTDWEYKGKVIPGNYDNGPKGEYREKTTPVGSFPPNAFGLYDLHGNVREWCGDTYQENYEGLPNDGSTWISEKVSKYVLRGGSWLNFPQFCRSALRYWNTPDDGSFNFGFRCCIASRTP